MMPKNIRQHVRLASIFMLGVVAILVLNKGFAPEEGTSLQATATSNGIGASLDKMIKCKRNEDCPNPITYCHKERCIPLKNPTCTCSQPQVLRCADEYNKIRHMFCEKGCRETQAGANCL